MNKKPIMEMSFEELQARYEKLYEEVVELRMLLRNIVSDQKPTSASPEKKNIL